MKFTLRIALIFIALGMGHGSYLQGEGLQADDHAMRVRSGFLQTADDLALFFPQTVADVQERTDIAIADARTRLAAIIAVPADERTYENTIDAFDKLCGFSLFSTFQNIPELISMVYGDAAMRDVARVARKTIAAFLVDEISNNVALYDAIKSYVTTTQESLSDEQRYYIAETIAGFKRGGLDLPEEKRAIIANLKKELADLEREFAENIATDTKSVTVSRQELAGLTEDFIARLTQTDDGLYILTTDYPTAFGVMQDCSVEETRKKMSRIFENRGYPANESVLKAVIAKRDALARELGFESYAHLDLADQMVKSPDNADAFLSELVEKSAVKEQAEFERLIAKLPESVTLTADGKIKSWDLAYVGASYKKTEFNLDERMIAEYFPMEETMKRLFQIYEQFMGLSFAVKPAAKLWHEDVMLVEVCDASTKKLLGYFLLDLYPRPNKYTHACHGSLVPSVTLVDGAEPYVVSVVIANFPRATQTQPSLLKREEVRTFFHEFGHALHGLLGRTKIASCSGTNVKVDFVEMPSQMLEEWLWQKDILKQVSCHYLTGESFSDELVDKIIALKHFNTGFFVQRQACLAFVSLNYYKAGADKDVSAMMHDLSTRIRPNIAYDDEAHIFASFGHLMGYGAKYYGYMWSKVYALDLFSTMKQHGLSREIGKKYVTDVLSKGGTKDPMDLLVAFLGREPQQDAFFKDLGL